MKRTLFAGLFLLLSAGACDSSSTSSEPEVVAVRVTPSARTIAVGESFQLTGEARDEDGASVDDATLSWRSVNTAIATVDQNGLVTGVAVGTARIIASYRGLADTSDITVANVNTSCSAAGATPQLAVGGSYTVTGAQASLLCLSGADQGAEYTVIPFYGSENSGASVSLRFDPSGAQAASGPPTPSVALASPFGRTAPKGDGGFHTRLNARATEGLTRLVPGARAAFERRADRGGARMEISPQAAPAIGSLMQLNTGLDFCTNPEYRTGRVVAVSSRAVVVADTGNPRNGFVQADYDQVAATFDTLVFPVDTLAFGAPADVDGNNRVIIFYTRAVNELTPRNAGYIVGGFFYSRDLFPRTATSGFEGTCAGSNYAEMFYLLVPDPTGEVNGNVRTTEDVRTSTVGVVGHEFQHLINASRRLYLVPGVGGTDWDEDVWLNEGLSHIAEELLFYHRAQVAPRGNRGGEVLDGQPLRSAFINFQVDNYARYGTWLEDPTSYSVYGDDDELATRGAAWSFLRYAADRRGGDDRQLWYNLVNNNRVGLANVRAQLGVDPVEWVHDWAVGAYTDDAVAGVPAKYTRPSWNHRSLFTAIENRYPLETLPLTTASRTVQLMAGTSAYLRTGVAGGRTASVAVSTAGGAPASTVWVTVVRTK